MPKGLEFTDDEDKIEVRKPRKFSYTTAYFKKKKSQMDHNFNSIKSDLRELSEHFSPRMCRFIVTDVNKPIKNPTIAIAPVKIITPIFFNIFFI